MVPTRAATAEIAAGPVRRCGPVGLPFAALGGFVTDRPWREG
jgi:hypothetical protein